MKADDSCVQKPSKASLWGRALLRFPGLNDSFNPGSCHLHMAARKLFNFKLIACCP